MKNIKILAAVTVAASALVANAAYAQESSTQGYVSVHGGVLVSHTVDTSFNDGAVTGKTKTDTGYRIGGSAGYNVTPNVAVEAEVSYASANLNEFTPTGGTAEAVLGKGNTLSLMGNVILGTNLGALRPYVGAGIGVAQVKIDVPAGEFGSDAAKDSQWKFAAQALAGVDYTLTGNISLGARYRYQYAGSTNLADAGSTPIALGNVNRHSVEAVLKFGF